jgi:hypothetical protein
MFIILVYVDGSFSKGTGTMHAYVCWSADYEMGKLTKCTLVQLLRFRGFIRTVNMCFWPPFETH